MKVYLISIILLSIVQTGIYSQTEVDLTKTKGPYLGQKAPLETAEVFAPGMITTDNNEALYGILNDGMTIIFDRSSADFDDWSNPPIYICEAIDGEWTQPRPTVHVGKPWYYNYKNPEEGEEIFYAWWLPFAEDGSLVNINIWRVMHKNGRWQTATKLPYPINTEAFDTWPSLTKDGILYFFSKREGGIGAADLYRSVPVNGQYPKVENLGAQVNWEGLDHDPAIASDESFLVFSSSRPGSIGKDDLYVTFRKENGSWTKPANLGEKINSVASDNRPYLSPDGKYLFFTSTRNGNLDIFWVNSQFIKKIKPD